MAKLEKLTIRGFKSIREEIDFELKNLNVFVGANGSGKSNFVSFFRMLRAFMEGRLSAYVTSNGGMGDMLFQGPKVSRNMSFEMYFGERGYRFALAPTVNDGCFVESEARWYWASKNNLSAASPSLGRWWELGGGSDQSGLAREAHGDSGDAVFSKRVYQAIMSWQIYHFHDTSATAGMRREEIPDDNERLREDAANIAPFLLRLKNDSPQAYIEIVQAIRLVLPFFEDFILKVEKKGMKEVVKLRWRQKNSDYPMQPYHFSDGSIRFICLVVALLQPYPPEMIILDEPELGLHPAAIVLLAELIRSAAFRTQVVVATQSPLLVDQFSVEDIVIVKRESGASTFLRLREEDLTEWLGDYSLGELWTKNVITGGPSYE